MFLLSLIVIFLHDSTVKHELEEEARDDKNVAFMANTTKATRDGVYGGNYLSIIPTTTVSAPNNSNNNDSDIMPADAFVADADDSAPELPYLQNNLRSPSAIRPNPPPENPFKK